MAPDVLYTVSYTNDDPGTPRRRSGSRHALRLGRRGRALVLGRRHPGAGGAQRLVRLPRPRPLARGGAGPRPRPHLQPQHQSHGGGVRGEAAAARRRGGRHQRFDRDGRDLGHAAHAARARRSRGVGQGHLRRHQPAVPARPAAARHRGARCATPPTATPSGARSPPAAGCSISRARPTRPSRWSTSRRWRAPVTKPARW